MTNRGSIIRLPEDDDELLKECAVQTYRSSGKGGQHVNKTETAVRLIHGPSGITVTCQSERSQLSNKKLALLQLREKVARQNYRKPKRIKTKTPQSIKRQILKAKKRRGELKKLRKKPGSSDW